MEIIILGAGISGLSAGYHFKKYGFNPTLYEKENKIGGLCRSKKYNSFIFDYGVHVSFTSNKYVRNLFAKAVKNNYEEKQLLCTNYWHGCWVKHQPQNNLHSLPKEVIKSILLDLIHVQGRDGYQLKVKNYHDWIYRHFGKFFAERFINEYTKKFWTVDARQLTTDWIGTRIQPPDLETVIKGAFDLPRQDNHYFKAFRYPKEGGYASFLQGLAAGLDIEQNIYPVGMDIKRKKIYFSNGKTKSYGALVSTIPLPQLIKCIEGVPKNVLAAVRRLRYTSLLMLNFSIKQKRNAKTQWNYYYDKDILYTRLVYTSRLSKNNAPKGYEALQAEIPYAKNKPLSLKRNMMKKRIIRYIAKTEGIEPRKINYLGDINIKYGYAICDGNRKKALKVIHEFLNKNKVYYCGRFGQWEHLWSDEAFLSAKKVADSFKNKGKQRKYDE